MNDKKYKEPKDPPRPATMMPPEYCPRCSPDTYMKDRGVNGRYKIRCEKCGGVWDWKHLTGYVFVEERPIPKEAPVEDQEAIWEELKNYINNKIIGGKFLTDAEWTFIIRMTMPKYIIKRKAP